MQQEAAGGEERRRQEVARPLRRHWLRRLGRKGAQEELLPRQGEVVGGFTLEVRLGAGGYGTVYRARRGDELFAVKLLYLPRTGAWAFREVEVLLRLHHAGLVRVEAHGYHGHHPEVGPLFLFLVMEYVPGLPLDEYAERHNPPARWAAGAALALAAQLSVAHAAGVVHRDVKADNVVVRRDGAAVLVDYGLGTFPGALSVSGGLFLASLRLRPPEVWRFLRGEAPVGVRYEASARDDLWALGVLLYWLLTGTWPFRGEREDEVEAAVLDTPLVPPHERNPRVPRALSAVCVRLLEKEPGARYPDAEAVAVALEEALAGADARWEVPLCEAWGPDNATTWREAVAGGLSLEQALARDRRQVAYVRERPRRGKPVPSPVEEAAPQAVAAPEPARAGSGAARMWRRARGALGVGALLALAHPHAVSRLAMPEVKPWSGQEVAPPGGPLEGDGGAVPSWATTSAPVARATLPEDTPVKTPPKDTGSPQQPRKQGQGRNAVATAVCTAAAGAVAAGCPGAQVRDTPAPEACPAGSVETMKRLGIRMGDDAGSNFPGYAGERLDTVREGAGWLILGQPLGQLSPGTVVTGRFLVGKERVYGRFTEVLTAGGDTYSVCLEAWDIGEGVLVRGLLREPDEGGPGAATVIASPHLKAVERFE